MGPRIDMSKDVVVAISAFRSDAAVIALLAEILADPHPEVLQIIVVDSLGSGEIQQTIKGRGWEVVYEDNPRNLGSAGNLAKRIEHACQLGAAWCLCLNHDANWSAARLTHMLAVARAQARVGAVYPILDHSPRIPAWEDGRRDFEPSAATRLERCPKGDGDSEVRWSSSNGALYATAPRAQGVRVMEELWMGYEDLAYGIALWLDGWKQVMCRDAILSDIFDYRASSVFGRQLYLPDKPAWYQFYDMRNLLLIRKRFGRSGISRTALTRKFFRSLLRIVFLEKQRTTRLHYLLQGALEGIRGRGGKWLKP